MIPKNRIVRQRLSNLLNLTEIHYLVGNTETAEKINGEVMEQLESLKLTQLLAKSQKLYGKNFLRKGQNKKAFQLLRQAEETFVQHQDIVNLLETSIDIIYCYHHQLKFAKAIEVCKEVSVQASRSKLENFIAQSESHLAQLYLNGENLEKALKHVKVAEKYCQKLDKNPVLIYIWGNISTVYVNISNFEKGLEYQKKKLVLSTELGDKHGICTAMSAMGKIYFLMEDINKGEELIRKGLEIAEELGETPLIINLTRGLIDVMFYKGDIEKVEHYFDKAEKLSREIDFKTNLLYVLFWKGFYYYNHKQYAQARELTLEAIKIATGANEKDWMFYCEIQLTKIDYALGDMEKLGHLRKMLNQADTKFKIALMHWHLFFIETGEQKAYHKKEALKLHQELYTQTHNIWNRFFLRTLEQDSGE